jgi:phage baseplate assembly protein W
LDDKRFEMMNNALNYLKSWEDDVEKSLMIVASTNLMTQETRTDINSALLTIIHQAFHF